jgi:Protein of unknown function (DUF3467)
MTEKAQPKLPSGQSVTWKDPDFPAVYANIMGFGMSPFDITLIFGEISDATITNVTATPRAKVILAPEQAANLVKLLSLALSSYVASNGQLRTSGAVDMENLQTQINTLKAALTQ